MVEVIKSSKNAELLNKMLEEVNNFLLTLNFWTMKSEFGS